MRRRFWQGLVLLLLATTAHAKDADDDHCTRGDATAALETWGSAVRVVGSPEAAMTDGRARCSYRLFFPGEVCFCEDDYFLAGSTALFETWEDAWSSWETSETIVTFADEALALRRTDVKPWLGTGSIVAWYQDGAILKLAPGSYESVYEADGDEPVSVTVTILPHEIAHKLGPALGATDGSVVCPAH